VDKFTKWIEARPVSKIKSKQAVQFFLNIIHRFGVPNSIIMDNGMQFMGKKFLKFCDDHHIRINWATVAHPRTNGQDEHANSMVLQGIKPRIFNKLTKFGRRWATELPAVLWSLRMTPSRATGYMPFFMVYSAKAVMAYKEQEAKEFLEDAMDQLDEARDVTLLHSARYQQALRWYHSRHVRGRAFNIEDLVLRLVQSNKDHHKLSLPWEGPYVIAEVL
jgi:transposase InsO family protein